MPSPTCIICDRTDGSLKIQCDGCKKYLHASCKSVDADEARCLTRQRAKGVRIFCNDCEVKIDQFADIKSILSSISDRLERLESCNNGASAFGFEDAVREAKERVQRENNVIVYGLSEEPDDQAVASNLLRTLSPSGCLSGNMVHVMRLGKDSKKKPRPLRITFNNPYSATDAFRLRNNLKSIPLYKSISLRRDQTVYQMNLFRDCQNKVKQMKNDGVRNVRIKYVRGVPGVVVVNPDDVGVEERVALGASAAPSSAAERVVDSGPSSSNPKNI